MFRVAGWVVAGFAGIAALDALYRVFPGIGPGEFASTCIKYAILYGCVAFPARRHFGFSWADLVPTRGVAAWLLVPILVASLGGVVLGYQANAFFQAVMVVPANSAQSAGPRVAHSMLHELVATSLLPGIAEEAIFRGLVLTALLATPMSQRRAIVVSGLLFAAVHFDLWNFPGALLGGLLYGWMFVRTRSLLPSMLAHAFHNGLLVLLSRLDSLPKSLFEHIVHDADGFLPAWLVWIGAALSAIGLVAFRMALRMKDQAARARREPSCERLDMAA